MKETESRTGTGLSDLEAPLSIRPETGDMMPGDLEPQQDYRERADREHRVANLRLLWEKRRLLGRVAGVGMLLSVALAFLLPSRYKSEIRLMPPDNQSGSGLAVAAAALSSGGGGAGGLGGMASELLGLKNTSDLLVGVLSSRTVEDKLIQQFDLRKVYGYRRMDDARRVLASRTNASVDRKNQIITVDVTDKSPQRAAEMAQAYAEELNRTLAAVSMSAARRERIFLEGRLQAVNQDLEASEKAFSQFASKNTAIDIKEQGKAMVDAAATLQGQLIAARSELEGLRQLYADGNVRVRSAEARVAELQEQLRKVGGKDESASQTGGTAGDSLYPSIRQLPLLGVPYADLYRKTKVEEAVFETLTQEYEMAKVQEAKEIPTVKILDPPNVPEHRSSPPRTLVVLLGTVFAFSCGVSWVFGRRAWERTDPADPGKVLAQEVIETVRAAMPWASRNGHRLLTESPRSGVPVGRTDVKKDSNE